MFRKLYFITEQTDPSGAFRATGVYTSIHDLIDHGMRWIEPTGHGFRISLVKLDCRSDVLAYWTGPKFEGLEAGVQRFVSTGEFGIDEVASLRQALDAFVGTAAGA